MGRRCASDGAVWRITINRMRSPTSVTEHHREMSPRRDIAAMLTSVLVAHVDAPPAILREVIQDIVAISPA